MDSHIDTPPKQEVSLHDPAREEKDSHQRLPSSKDTPATSLASKPRLPSESPDHHVSGSDLLAIALKSSPRKDNKDSYESSELSDLGDDDSEAETDKMDFLDDDANHGQGEKVSDLRRISHLTELAHLEGVDTDDSDDSDGLNNSASKSKPQPLKGSATGPHEDGADTTIFESFRTDISDTEETDALKRPRTLEEADLIQEPPKKARLSGAADATAPASLKLEFLKLEYSPILDAAESPKANAFEEASESLNATEEKAGQNGLDPSEALKDTYSNGNSNGVASTAAHNGTLLEGTQTSGTSEDNVLAVSKAEDFKEPKLEDIDQLEAEEAPEDESEPLPELNANEPLSEEEEHEQVKDEYSKDTTQNGDESYEKNSNLGLDHDDDDDEKLSDVNSENDEKEHASRATEDESPDDDDAEVTKKGQEAVDDDENAPEAADKESDSGEQNHNEEDGDMDAEEAEEDGEEDEEEVDLDIDEQRKNAVSELISIEEDFSFLRDKLYNDKLALLEHEMELCLDGSHPELLQIYYKVNEFYQQNIKISNSTLNYSLKCINTETMATRTSIHQDFMKNLTDMKNDMVAETTSLWYKINRERNYLDQIVPDYNFAALPQLNSEQLNMAIVAGGSSVEYYQDSAPISKKAMNQNTIVELVLRRNDLNEQLGVLNGLKEFHGFPCAVANSLLDDDVCSVEELLLRKATPDEVNEDLQAMGIY